MMQNIVLSPNKIAFKDDFHNQTNNIRPMDLKTSLLYFGIPAIIMAFCYYFLIPIVERLGISKYNSFFTGHILFMSFLIVVAILALKLEGIDTIEQLKIRTRFVNFKLRYVAIAGIVFIIMSFFYGFFDAITQNLLKDGVISIPSFVPILGNPTITLDTSMLTYVVGAPLKGNWGIIAIFLVSLILNIVGEELWWRGYILPRQEVQFGKYTWILHGFLWTFFHAFKYWDLLGLLPVCLIISYMAQKQKNNWTVFMAHLIFNGLMIFILITPVLGM